MMKFDSKWVKYLGGAVGGMLAGIILMFGGVKVVYPAISQLVGLAVAESATLWNNVKDGSAGDALTNGVLMESLAMWNGTAFDRLRGSITNGILVDVTRMSGSITPADGYVNPTTANQVWSLEGVFNGTTWDRWRGGVSPTSSGTSLNAIFNSAANAVGTITLTGTAGQRIHLYKITEIACQVDGSSSFVVNDGAA